MSELKKTIASAVKDAMRAKDKPRLGVLRMVQAEFKRIEVDERIEIDDARVLVVLDKMLKQRKDSAQQFRDADRIDLAEQEETESTIIQEFLPAALSEEEVATIIDEAIASSGAESARDMGKVMALVKPQVQGRGDMGIVSQLVKAKLA
ncbi:GatB/YqeY domain-containing protein [uncultured Pseudoteredinibacter sp.]|uniref:GatB/YqeY domain-containing protein n=1 Tax=uncultured Pseudoteredinibacter sp. TaxID=1641701 RepID=UPI00261BCF7D|nr:GatB/YqeY domain-containing protein [uncultured Pseudoteredinibacter sp.]